MSTQHDDHAIRDGVNCVAPPPDSVIERVTPALRAALFREESRLAERCASVATVELHDAAIKAVNLAHANLSTFLAADTAHPDGPTSQSDYYRFAYALIDRITEARKAGVDVRLDKLEIRR